MFIEILRQVMIAGEPAKAGSVLDLPDSAAQLLIGMGKATATTAPVVVEAPAEPAAKPVKAKPPTTKPTLPLED